MARRSQGVPKVMARTWQGDGILFAYSNRPFEYGYTMPSLCEHYAKCGRRVWLVAGRCLAFFWEKKHSGCNISVSKHTIGVNDD